MKKKVPTDTSPTKYAKRTIKSFRVGTITTFGWRQPIVTKYSTACSAPSKLPMPISTIQPPNNGNVIPTPHRPERPSSSREAPTLLLTAAILSCPTTFSSEARAGRSNRPAIAFTIAIITSVKVNSRECTRESAPPPPPGWKASCAILHWSIAGRPRSPPPFPVRRHSPYHRHHDRLGIPIPITIRIITHDNPNRNGPTS